MSLLKTKIVTKVWVEFGEISSAEAQEVRTWGSKAGKGRSYLGPRRSRHRGGEGGECLAEARIGHNPSAQQEESQGICIRSILSGLPTGKPILGLQGSSILTMAVVRLAWQRVECSASLPAQMPWWHSKAEQCSVCSVPPQDRVWDFFGRNGSSNCRRLEPLHFLS